MFNYFFYPASASYSARLNVLERVSIAVLGPAPSSQWRSEVSMSVTAL
jgi:hypothetical protein